MPEVCRSVGQYCTVLSIVAQHCAHSKTAHTHYDCAVQISPYGEKTMYPGAMMAVKVYHCTVLIHHAAVKMHHRAVSMHKPCQRCKSSTTSMYHHTIPFYHGTVDIFHGKIHTPMQ